MPTISKTGVIREARASTDPISVAQHSSGNELRVTVREEVSFDYSILWEEK